jgi:simple sugar transport system permease protein
LKLRAVGLGKEGARFAGIHVERTMLIAALTSGGIAGIAGYVEVSGIHYHLIGELSPGYGYTGIIIATMGGLNALGVAASALFFGLVERLCSSDWSKPAPKRSAGLWGCRSTSVKSPRLPCCW